MKGRRFGHRLVWGWWGAPPSSLWSLRQGRYAVGKGVSRQGLGQRFRAEAAQLLGQGLKFKVGPGVERTGIALRPELGVEWAGRSECCPEREGGRGHQGWAAGWTERSAARQPWSGWRGVPQAYEADSLSLADGGDVSRERLTHQHQGQGKGVRPVGESHPPAWPWRARLPRSQAH